MTLAMVKVLPEPVTPSRVMRRLAVAQALEQGADGLRLVSRRDKGGGKPKRPGVWGLVPSWAPRRDLI